MTERDTKLTRCMIEAFGGPESIQIRTDQPLPVPGAGQVRVAVEASCVQFTDTIIRRGKYPDAGKPPLTLGYDCVGRVDALGAGVVGWSVGDRVADMTVIGANASHLLCRADALTTVPDGLDGAEACALILSGVTAYQMLHRHARITAGQRVLVQGGNGGVGWFAVQLALRAGARVWTTARPGHQSALRAFGANTLDYRDPGYPAQLRAESEGGVDWVFDGQGADGFRASLASLRPGGKLALIGTSEAVNQGRSMIWSGARALARNLWPFGPRIALYSVTTMRRRHAAWFGEDLRALFQLLMQRELAVRIDRRIGFDAIAAAHAELERGGVSGKIVLLPAL